ncbi:putative membrane protein YesL [Aequitasia blattaphilus]|uniref:DUF624 domain-containing protein n=1 Tax=Aequitasia blattaphilus TaxID=2949332 RepID=A0ABT1E9Q4_9FIRM|nr:DUF624 domain-containing protein [Aequitasia blattaphilus]MCP1102339.1 DUF624 domain-containing protein [Aequitasia blattaphilus]MCR8614979.1 DUF624 domain-containing protein [Aequitasia blattaphilus]
MNFFTRISGKILDLIKLNLLFIVSCIPIITIGASTTALYYNLLKMVRDEESYLFRDYKKSFKENFLQATTVWMVLLLALIIIYNNLGFVGKITGYGSIIGYMLLALLAGVAVVILYVFPLIARYQNTSRQMIRNAFVLAFTNLKTTVLIVLSCVMAPLLVIADYKLFPYYILYMILIGVSGPAYLSSILFRKMFDRLEGEDGIPHERKSKEPV